MTETERVEERKKKAIDRLTERFARDELPMDQYERLVADINRASSSRELAVVEDIVGVPGVPDAETAAETGRGAEAAAETDAADAAENGFLSEDAVQACSAVMAERVYRGNWLRKGHIAASTVMASQVFDFTGMDNLPARTTLDAMAVMGSIDIVVPENLAVRMDVSPVMGEARIGRGVETSESSGLPLLVVTGNAILGSVRVKLG